MTARARSQLGFCLAQSAHTASSPIGCGKGRPLPWSILRRQVDRDGRSVILVPPPKRGIHMTDAYSLIRMSTPGQAEGDSTRRQELLPLAGEFCANHGLNLVDTLHVVGSAFHGRHVASGPLADFLKL